MQLKFNAKSYSAEPSKYGSDRVIMLDVEICDTDDVLENFSISDVISFFGEDKLLDVIGMPNAVEHFGIEVKE